ncbi:MAG: DUF4162 domain-containing protein, partial [Promethearchaeota archaeon]
AKLKGDTILMEFENHEDLKKLKKRIKDFAGINAIKLVTERNNNIPNPQNMPGHPPMSKKITKEMMEQMQKMMSKMKDQHATKLNITIENGSEKIPEIIKIANDLDVKIKSLTIKQPSLEDVFIHYTGRSIRAQEGEGRIALIRKIVQSRMGVGRRH